MISAPNPTYSQPNNSDKFGNIQYSKNINLDEEGYIKNSPRTVQLYDEAANSDFDLPVMFGRYSNGDYIIPTTDSAFNGSYDSDDITFEENEGTNNPNLSTHSHGVIWQSRIHASENTTVVSKALAASAGTTWDDRVTGLTTGVRHYMCVFLNRNQLCVTNGNVVKQYDEDYVNTTDLTIPSDFEAIGLSYNNNTMGVITRLGSETEGQNREAYFFLWNGSTTTADLGGWGVGAEACVAICAYKTTFAILTKNGQLKMFNGGGFDDLGSLPFYFTDKVWGNLVNPEGKGEIMTAEGDVIYINLGLNLETYGRKLESHLPNSPSGVWCYDPALGDGGSLYHRNSASISQAYAFVVTDTNVDTTTNILQVSSGTLPQTGCLVRYTAATTVLGGLRRNHDYYLIKLTSNTFSLAETKALAVAGTAIDITSKGAGINNFWMYDLIDYSQTYTNEAGGVSIVGDSNMLNRDLIFGTDTFNSSLTDNANVCICVPELEARGYFVTPRMYSTEGVTDSQKTFLIKHRPLKEGDSIVVKTRTRQIVGLPITTPQGQTTSDEATWVNSQTFITKSDLTEALEAFENGYELELELVSGVGGGTMVKIEDLRIQDTDYVIVTEEEVIGAANGLKSFFIIDHWIERTTVDSDSSTNDLGYAEIPIGSVGSWMEAKIELRGVEVSIADWQLINSVDKNGA